MASEISIEKCLSELRETVLNRDKTLKYTDVDIQFKDFETPKTLIYLDRTQKLHIFLDDVFSEYSSHKLEPLVLHALDWHEGRERYMYPQNIDIIMFTRPEFMENIRRKFNRKYQVPSCNTIISPELLTALDSIKGSIEKKKKGLYEFSKDVLISWRAYPRNLEKSPIADTDAFCNRIFLDPAVASAPPKVRTYILLHELAVIRYYNPQSLKTNSDKVAKALRSYQGLDEVLDYMSAHGWRFRHA